MEGECWEIREIRKPYGPVTEAPRVLFLKD
jgi:hypothetical protein